MAYVVSVVNAKGGVGKSTIAINLAQAFHLAGQKTILIDHDSRQGTASKWRRHADEQERDVVLVTSADSDLSRLVKDLRQIYEVIIIDGPGHMNKTTTAMVSSSDRVLIPIQPSSVDLWACEELLEWIEKRQMITGGEPEASFVLSRCNADWRVSRDEVEEIASQGFPTLTSRTVQRVSYARTLANGGTVFDLQEGDKARAEIQALYEEITDDRS